MQVTTTSRRSAETWARARRISELPAFSLVRYPDRDQTKPVLLVGREGLCIATGAERFRWHPGLLHTRLEAGWRHPLVRASGVQPGDRVLDCTLGLGIDARFFAHLTGRAVVGVEAVAAIALMTAEGLARVRAPVRVVHAESTTLLASLASGAFDVVQGDPMFPPGTGVNHSLAGVRAAARHAPLPPEWLHHARRVARRAVVVRDVDPGTLLEEMSCPEVLRVGRGRPRYGVWRS